MIKPASLGNALLLLLVALASTVVQSHPDTDRVRAELAVVKWASGIQNRDADSVAMVLADNFSYFDKDKNRYLADVNETIIGKTVLSHAEYAIDDGGITVSPVVIYENINVRIPRALTLKLIRQDDKWLISKITVESGVPDSLIDRGLPEAHGLYEVGISILDELSGKPVAARVRVTDSDGNQWPPHGHMKNVPTGWREEIGGDVVVGDFTYAYVPSEFAISLPIGEYEIEVIRGFEYEPESAQFAVSETRAPTIDVQLKRRSNIRSENWYSGDSHVHFMDPQTALLEAQAEDLNVVNILATKWGELITNVNQFTGAPSKHSTPDYIVYVSEETRHDFLGHANLLGLKSLVYPLSWGEGGSGVPGGFDYPPVAVQADRAHAEGGFVSWAHFPTPYGEVAIDIALKKIDAVDVVTWGNPFDENRMFSPVPSWYRFLNCGFDLPAMGGTDKMWNTQVTGSVRTYVRVEGEFSYDAWINGARAGRTFVSTGPILRFSANGKSIGDTIKTTPGEKISFSAKVESVRPVDRLEIIVNGEIVAVKDKVGSEGQLEGEFVVGKSSWIAARTYSSEILPYQGGMSEDGIPVLAHTSPIYIEVDGKRRQSATDAAYFIEWIDQAITWVESTANYRSEQQRSEVIELFEGARTVYDAQLRTN